MQQYADIYWLLNYSKYFECPSHPSSGVHKTVAAAPGTDLYQKLQLQFYVPLMMGTMDTWNIQSNLAVNKYLHTVASQWISSTQNYDAWNHEY